MTETKKQNVKTYPMDNDFLSICLKYYETRGMPFTYNCSPDQRYITAFLEPNIQEFENVHKTNQGTLAQINAVLNKSEIEFMHFQYNRSPYKQKAQERFDELNKDNIGKMTFETIGQGLDEANEWAIELYLKDSQFPEKLKNNRIKVLMVLQQKDALIISSLKCDDETATITDSEETVTTFITPANKM